MRLAALGLLAALALVSGGCRKKVELALPPDPDLPDVPLEIALEKLRELLPTCDSVVCTNPKESFKPTDLKEWSIGKEILRVIPVKDKYPTFVLNYADMKETRLDRYGKVFLARIYATPQTDPSKDYLSFQWKTQEPAQQVVRMFESIRLKKK